MKLSPFPDIFDLSQTQGIFGWMKRAARMAARFSKSDKLAHILATSGRRRNRGAHPVDLPAAAR
jgi:hypothetical protein